MTRNLAGLMLMSACGLDTFGLGHNNLSAGHTTASSGMGSPVGDSACMTGFCGEANVMGLFKIGICGACHDDQDCVAQDKFKCNDPEVNLDTGVLTGAFCS